jgi:hypothetical protein
MRYIVIEELVDGTYRMYTKEVLKKQGPDWCALRFPDIRRLWVIELTYGFQLYGCVSLDKVSCFGSVQYPRRLVRSRFLGRLS